MLIEITSKKKNKLTKKENEACLKLNFGTRGQMRYSFKAYGDNLLSRIILAKHRNKIVGWALLFPSELKFDNGQINSNQNLDLHVYVSKNYRNIGIGTLLIERASLIIKRRRTQVTCFRHDEASIRLYKNFTHIGLKKR